MKSIQITALVVVSSTSLDVSYTLDTLNITQLIEFGKPVSSLKPSEVINKIKSEVKTRFSNSNVTVDEKLVMPLFE